MSKNDLHIDILGTQIDISSDEEPEYLAWLLEKYRQTVANVQRLSGLEDPLDIAVLTGFLLSDDLEKAGTETSRDKNDPSEVEKITLGMISRLDALMPRASLEEESPAKETPPGFIPETFYKLKNTVKNYDWGSPDWIPALFRQKNLGRVPWAELWMGVNPAGPSRVFSGSGEDGLPELTLSELIGRDKEAFLGKGNFKNLPFLLKLEAVAEPLSIQVHPGREQAQEGFDRENREGIPIDAPNRNYRDNNHKPEIICALGPFAALCGFRRPEEISGLLEILSGAIDLTGANSQGLNAGFDSLINALKPEIQNPLKSFLTALYSLSPEAREALGLFIKDKTPLLKKTHPMYDDEWELCRYFANSYPGDPGIMAPLYLNIMELENGDAMYLPAGIFHSYIHGLGIELMADSDNVLRGGLTRKYVDQAELFRNLSFSPYKPQILKTKDSSPEWYSYPAYSDEFVLSVMNGSGNVISWPEEGPSILVVTWGKATLIEKAEDAKKDAETELSAGESVFIPAGKNSSLWFSGNFTAYIAGLPCRSS